MVADSLQPAEELMAKGVELIVHTFTGMQYAFGTLLQLLRVLLNCRLVCQRQNPVQPVEVLLCLAPLVVQVVGIAGELVFEVVCKAQFALVAAPLVELLDDGRWQPFFAARRYGHHIDEGQVAGFQRGADAGHDGVNVFGRLLVCPAQGKQARNVRPQAG